MVEMVGLTPTSDSFHRSDAHMCSLLEGSPYHSQKQTNQMIREFRLCCLPERETLSGISL